MAKSSTLNWMYFPKSQKPPPFVEQIVNAFLAHESAIASTHNKLSSNEVLSVLASDLRSANFLVEGGKKKEDKISVPVFFGKNGRVEKSYEVDAFLANPGVVLEVEAGRATINHQYLKDFLEACLMNEVNYFAVAVRNIYEAAGMKNEDFRKVVTFFETLYASQRMSVPLKGILVIGY